MDSVRYNPVPYAAYAGTWRHLHFGCRGEPDRLRRAGSALVVLPELTPSSSKTPGQSENRDPTSSRRLLERARRGSRSAVNALFNRHASWLRRWARGRLPQWARGAVDTSDLVQDTLHGAFTRLPWFQSKHAGALRAYLRRALENRIRDELRRAACRMENAAPAEPVRSMRKAPQLQQLMDEETWGRYLQGLKHLSARDRRLIVGRAELGYNYRQLAFVESLSSADTARKALQRALERLISVMPDA